MKNTQGFVILFVGFCILIYSIFQYDNHTKQEATYKQWVVPNHSEIINSSIEGPFSSNGGPFYNVDIQFKYNFKDEDFLKKDRYQGGLTGSAKDYAIGKTLRGLKIDPISPNTFMISYTHINVGEKNVFVGLFFAMVCIVMGIAIIWHNKSTNLRTP